MNILAIDVGGTYTKYGILSAEGEILMKDKLPTTCESTDEFVAMLAAIDEAVREAYAPVGIALSAPGFIDPETGVMHTGGKLTFVHDFNIIEALSAACGMPVTVENDARCAALAELQFGALRGCRNAAVIVLGTGVGGGVIVGGEVIHGRGLLAGEFSYLLQGEDSDYTMNRSNAALCSVPALLELAAERLEVPLAEMTGEVFFARVNAGEERALGVLRTYCARVAILIHNLQFIIEPERVAIGGGISAQEALIGQLRREMASLNECLPVCVPMMEIVPCMFLNDANLFGAASVFMRRCPQV